MQTQLNVSDTQSEQKASPTQSYKPVPAVTGGLPLLGHTVEFAANLLGLLQRAYSEHGEVAGLKVFGRDIVLLSGPDAQEALFRAPDEVLSPNEAYKIMTPVFGKDIVYDASPERMAEQLGMLRPALQDKRMRSYGEIVARETRKAVDSWGESGDIDLVEFCAQLTNYTSTHCLIGREFREQMSEEFARVYYDLERGVTPAAYIHSNLPLPSMIKRNKARARLVSMIDEIVQQRQKSGEVGEDFLQTLMDARYKNGDKLSPHEITGMLLASMFAGHHTSSVSTAWTLIELIKHPDFLDRVLHELNSVYQPGDDVTFMSLRQIPLTELAVKESLRLHPPLYILLRSALVDFEYAGHLFPKGTWLATSPWVSHRMGSVFKDPEKFDPDRFGPGREEDKKQFSFIAFGGGRHKCLGNAFALLQVKTIFAILLRGFRFELLHDPIVPESGLVMGPKKPFRVRYRRLLPNGSF